MINNSVNQAVQFGAGNIGRGFIGVMLSKAGYGVTFVDVVDTLLEHLNRDKKYTIREVSESQTESVTVENVNAIDGRAEADVVSALAQTSLVTTAVGPNVLPIIAKAIAKGIQKRAELKIETPLNIIACENQINNSQILRGYVFEGLSEAERAYADQHVGFPNCVVDKVVTSPTEEEQAANPLLVIGEGTGLLIVDQTGFVGDPPVLSGMELTDNLPAYVEQKIFTLNTAHAVTAYLGYLRSYEFIHESLQDVVIYQIVSGVLEECSAVLVKRHGLDEATQRSYVGTVLGRFTNATLPDPVTRVAREPKRKLGPGDRLIQPALLALEMDIEPTQLATGIAAALLYDHTDDPEAMEIRGTITENGLDAALATYCGLDSDHELARLIKTKLSDLQTSLS
ncbi:MAG: mannitol-1-phosphate 5-dehydrogenase [Chloroflexota bacterium]